MPDHLVDDVRLGRVERAARMAQVLRRVEHAVGERAVELVERDEPGGGKELEAGERLQPRGDLVELGHVVGGQRERGLGLAERAAGEPLVLGRELAADGAPDLVLGLGVLHLRDRRARLPGERRGGDLVAAPAVLGVGGAGMVVGQVDLDAVGPVGHRCVELTLFEHPPRSTRAARPRATRQCVSFRTMTTMERLGELDRKILALLQRDGRRSFADIGREVGLSTPGGQAPRQPARGRGRDPRLRGGGRRVQARLRLRGDRGGLLRRSHRAAGRARERRPGSPRSSAPSRSRASPMRCCACRSTTSATSSA